MTIVAPPLSTRGIIHSPVSRPLILRNCSSDALQPQAGGDSGYDN